MARRKIGKRVVDSLQSDEIVWDTTVPGFGVRRQREARIFFVKYRFSGRQRWYRIGAHGAPWTVKLAREKAKAVLGQVAQGLDPAALREADRNRRTMAELCDHYLKEYAEHHKRPSSVESDRRNIENHVKPLLGRTKVADVTRADVDRFKRAVKEGKTAKDIKRGPRARSIVTGGTGASNRCLALLSRMFNLAERWGWRDEGTNPCRHVDKYREGRRERFLSEIELAHLGDTLRAIERDGTETPHVVAAIRLLIFTGARLGEILGLRWEHVDFDRTILHLPNSKTGAKPIYLSAPALETLTTVPRLAGNPHVVVGERDGAALVNLQKPWRRIRASATIKLWGDQVEAGSIIAALTQQLGRTPKVPEIEKVAKKMGVVLPPGLLDVRIHDLRHSYASVGAAGGLSLPMIGRLLGHTQAATTQRYAHLAADPVKAANEAIGQRIAAMLKGDSKSGSAKVVEIPKRGA